MSFDPMNVTISAHATLRIAGQDLDPEYITKLIRTKPTVSWRKGEKVKLPNSRTEVRKKIGMWLLNTEDHVHSLDLDEHIEFVYNILFGLGGGSRSKAIKLAMEMLDLSLTVSLFWHGAEDAPEPHIPEQFSAYIKLVGGKLTTDFATNEPEPEYSLRLG